MVGRQALLEARASELIAQLAQQLGLVSTVVIGDDLDGLLLADGVDFLARCARLGCRCFFGLLLADALFLIVFPA